MHVLYIAQRVPYPPDRGDKIITYHQIRHLAKTHRVTVACLAEGDEDLEHAESLRSIVPDVHAVPLSPLRARCRALQDLARGRPFTKGYFREPELVRSVRSILQTGNVDVAIVFCSGMAQFVEDADDLPRIIHFADLDSLKWKNYANTVRIPQRWVYAAESRRLLEYERYLARTFNHSLVCTELELADFKELIYTENASCVPNGIDLEYFLPVATEKRPHSLVFTGVMDYLPNVDGMVWFCEEILPLIKKRYPDVTLTICGSRPERKVLELADIPGVEVTGRVPDVRPYLSRSSVAVVPLRLCRGIQNKVLEAMAMGLPVVTTSAAFGGIDATDGEDLLVADQADQIANSVLRLFDDNPLREQIGDAARSCIEANYSWDVPLAQLDSIIEAATQPQDQAEVQIPQPRLLQS